MTFPGSLEAAFGADRDADPDTYTWTSLTTDVADDQIAISKGRRSGPGSVAEAAQATVNLTNVAGKYTARKATSTHYPNVKRGLAVRHYLNQGARYLHIPGVSGARFATTDKATLDILSDIYIAIEYRSPIKTPITNDFAQDVGKWDETTPSQSWEHDFGADGISWLFWSVTGADIFSASSTLPVPCPDQGPLTHGIYLDVNNGAGGHTCYFWAYKGTITELNAALAVNERRWRLGDPFVGVGATSIFNSTAPLEIGDLSNNSVDRYAGGINRVEVRAGNWTGTVAANPDFTTPAVGTTSFADTAPTANTWTAAGTAAITDRKIRLLGELTANAINLPGHGVAGTAQAQWTVSGLLARLRQGDPPLDSPLFQRIMSRSVDDLVDAYWPMEDGRDAESAYSPIAGVPPMFIGGLAFASDSDMRGSKPLPAVGPSTAWVFTAEVPSSTADDWEVTWLVKIETPSVGATPILLVNSSGTARRWEVLQDAANVSLLVQDASGGGLLLDTFAWSTSFEYRSLVTLEAILNGGNVDYVLTWVPLEGPGAGGGTVMSGSFAATLGRVTRIANLATSPPDGLTMGHVALTSGATVGWLAGADQAFNGEACAARAYRLCQQKGYRILVDGAYLQSTNPDFIAPLNVAAGEQTMGPQPITTLLGALTECAEVSNGILGEATETLALTFRSGHTLYNQTAALTSGNATIAPLQPSDDDRDIVNDATVTRPDGSSGRYVDTVHQASEGQYPDSRTRNTETDARLQHHASWWVHEATTPEMQIPGLNIEIAKDTSLINNWLDTSRGDLVRHDGLPDALVEDWVEQLMDGVVETIGSTRWLLTINGRQARPYKVLVLSDASYGKLSPDNSTLSSSATTTATSLSVASVTGSLWDPADAEDGFDIDIGGEQITVTDISGTTSPQTFSVTRSVNGVVKAHSSGAVVTLWRPAVLAL